MSTTIEVQDLALLHDRLESLNEHCLTNLLIGLTAMREGDLTVRVEPATAPLDMTGHPVVDELAALFNSMLSKAQDALVGYNAVREDLRERLGDRSILADLDTRMASLNNNCLTSLGNGLQAMTGGDLTVDAQPVTSFLAAGEDESIGTLGETFNSMLAKAQAGLGLYNTTRSTLEAVAGDLATALTELQSALSQLADGDLTGEVNVDLRGLRDGTAQGIFKRMLQDADDSVQKYETTRDALIRLMTDIRSAAQTVSASSTEMASASEQAGRAVEEIAAAIQEVAAGAELQTGMVAGARAAAEKTAAEADQAREVAGQGVIAAQQASEAMDAVTSSTGSVTAAINDLAAKSEQIGGIVGTITGIASQTNLLALNAAIEAARAGEQGRGFSVVADEVRKLAEQSQAAASHIAELVREIQNDTQRTVAVADDGAKRTADGVEIVQRARGAFEQIGLQVEGVTAQIAQIVDATTEVAAAAEQSAASTEEISASTEETSASAEEISASAQELAATAHQLEALVDAFKIAA